MRRIFSFIEEPRGDLLRSLIRALAGHSSAALVVLRDGLGLGEVGQTVLSRLEPHLIERTRSSSWPGTTLLGDEATVHRFSIDDAVVDLLLEASVALYGWQQPSLPEDLALLRADGTAILASISHERDSFLELSEAEYERLASAIPRIAEILRAPFAAPDDPEDQ